MAESAKLYIEQYQNRLTAFLSTFESTVEDFILRELEKFSAATDDYEYYCSLTMDNEFGAPESYWMAEDAIKVVGYDRVYYSSKRKIEFLNQQKDALSRTGLPHINTGDASNNPPVLNEAPEIGTIDFTEGAQSYIDNYEGRAARFMEDFIPSELEFIMRQTASIGDPMRDFEFCKNYPNPLEYNFRHNNGLPNVVNAVAQIGYDEYYSANTKKIEFLKQRASQLTGYRPPLMSTSSIPADGSDLMTIRAMKAKAIVPGTPMEDIVNHFLPMTEVAADNGEPFLTTGQLSAFLKRGFLKDQTQPKQKISCPPGYKGFVVKRFYEFYKKAKIDYDVPDRKEPFIALFIDCFDNWDRSTVESLFRGNKTRKKWE